MFGLSTSHILILGFIVLLFGSKRLPEFGASLGKALRAFKDATDKNTPELTHQYQNNEQTTINKSAEQAATKV